jgi:hypothetical protein
MKKDNLISKAEHHMLCISHHPGFEASGKAGFEFCLIKQR